MNTESDSFLEFVKILALPYELQQRLIEAVETRLEIIPGCNTDIIVEAFSDMRQVFATSQYGTVVEANNLAEEIEFMLLLSGRYHSLGVSLWSEEEMRDGLQWRILRRLSQLFLELFGLQESSLQMSLEQIVF